MHIKIGNLAIKLNKNRKTKIIYHLYVESKKNDTNELIYKAEIDIENKLMVNTGEKGVRDKSGVRY